MQEYIPYLASMRRIEALRPVSLYPSHGETPVSGGKVGNRQISRDLQHRSEREAQILQALSNSPSNIEEIVTKVYGSLPEDLKRGASKVYLATNTGHYLAELVRRGQVTPTDFSTWRLS